MYKNPTFKSPQYSEYFFLEYFLKKIVLIDNADFNICSKNFRKSIYIYYQRRKNNSEKFSHYYFD